MYNMGSLETGFHIVEQYAKQTLLFGLVQAGSPPHRPQICGCPPFVDCFIVYAKAFDFVDHNKWWEILKEMGVPDFRIAIQIFHSFALNSVDATGPCSNASLHITGLDCAFN